MTPLQGLTFLEVGHGSTVGYAGRLLALLGATVVTAAAPAATRDPAPEGSSAALWQAGKHWLPPTPAEQLGRLPVAGALDGAGLLAGASYPVVAVAERDALAAWAESGGMWLTGHADGPPLGPPADLAGRLRGAAAALALLTTLAGETVAVDGPALVGERAACDGLARQGQRSPGGACRLLPAADGWVAVNLPRAEDRGLVPAWLGIADPDWPAIAAAVAARPAAAVAADAQLLGLPVALLAEPAAAAEDAQARARGQRFPPAPFLLDGAAPRLGSPAWLDGPGAVPPTRRPAPTASRAVDLSSLWAGPLVGDLLARAGTQVHKAESPDRPDGARVGSPALYALLNDGKQPASVDLADRAGAAGLLTDAEVVIEGSRPRALDNAGLGPEALLGAGGLRVWVSLTGYGRSGPARQGAALGDDAAVAGGAVAVDADGLPVFCADALADPAAGLHAALAAVAGLLGTGPVHIDVAMREVVGHLLLDTPVRAGTAAAAREEGGGWWVETAEGAVAVAAPRRRRSSVSA